VQLQRGKEILFSSLVLQQAKMELEEHRLLSADITADSAQDLPAVQVGDPFQEKKLLEACLELIPKGALVGMQDMGAAGIICSTAETSAKGGVGMVIHLEKVPMRQQNMKAWELLLSESQERMLMIVKKGREKEVLDVFEKWDLPCSEIGHVTTDGLLKFFMHDELEAEIPSREFGIGRRCTCVRQKI